MSGVEFACLEPQKHLHHVQVLAGKEQTRPAGFVLHRFFPALALFFLFYVWFV